MCGDMLILPPWVIAFEYFVRKKKGTISWKVKFRNGKEKNFVSPITTKPWGKHIQKLAEKEVPNKEALDSQLLFFEPDGAQH